jgi:replicative DNA helicase
MIIRPLKTITSRVEASADELQRIIKTDFSSIDTKYLGIVPKELWVIGAYTGTGKTFFGLQLALNILRQKKKVAYFSLEMASEALLARIWGNIAGLSAMNLEYGLLKKEEYQDKLKAKEELDSYEDSLFLIDNSYNLYQIKQALSDLDRAGKKPDVVFIDFIQNLQGSKDEYSKLTEATVEIQKFAKEKELSFMVLSQIANAYVDGAESSKIIGYKGSGGIATGADFGLWLTKEIDYNSVTKTQNLELLFRKVRRGPQNKIPLKLTFPGGRIEERA